MPRDNAWRRKPKPGHIPLGLTAEQWGECARLRSVEGWEIKELAARYGVKIGSLTQIMYRRGIDPPKHRMLARHGAALLRLIEDGASLVEASEHLGICAEVGRRILAAMGHRGLAKKMSAARSSESLAHSNKHLIVWHIRRGDLRVCEIMKRCNCSRRTVERYRAKLKGQASVKEAA